VGKEGGEEFGGREGGREGGNMVSLGHKKSRVAPFNKKCGVVPP
jgi:hypothetical protein